MVRLTDITGYAEAHQMFSKQALWDLFDGDREHLNIGHECVDRHDPERMAINIALAEADTSKSSLAICVTTRAVLRTGSCPKASNGVIGSPSCSSLPSRSISLSTEQ